MSDNYPKKQETNEMNTEIAPAYCLETVSGSQHSLEGPRQRLGGLSEFRSIAGGCAGQSSGVYRA